MSELPKGWVEGTLADCCEIIAGQSPPGETYNEERRGLPFYQGKAEFNDLYPTPRKWCTEPTKIAVEGDVLISVRAPVGPTNLANETCCIGRGLAALRPREGAGTKFVLYQMRATERKLAEVATGSTFSAVSSQQLKTHTIVLAPTAEQDRIVAEVEKQFTRLDAATAALKRVQANLRRYRASVLKAACEGRLVPTEAELARKESRDYEPADQLLQRILRERRARWEADTLAKMVASGKPPKDDHWKQKYKEPAAPDTTGLPELPEGWCWATFEQVSEIQGGIQKQPLRRPQTNAFPFLRVANVLRGRLDLSGMHEIELFSGELERLRLEYGDLLIVEGNGSPTEIGRMAVWDGKITNCVHQNHIIRARPIMGAQSDYLACFWNSPTGSSQVMAVASSTTGLHTLSVGKIAGLHIPLPPVSEQVRIIESVREITALIDRMGESTHKQSKRGASLRRAVLADAFSGKLVPQDPTDEPASVLLERIRASRVSSLNGTARRNRKPSTACAAR
jgi:type I restriction enzyme S subunit